MSQGCYNYVCSDKFPKCTKKDGDNVYVNSGACGGKHLSTTLFGLPDGSPHVFIVEIDGQECYISEDESESHCMKKIETDFPTFLYPGYKCSIGSSSDQCTFGPK